MTLETCRGVLFYIIYVRIVYQVGTNKGIILRCTAYQISRLEERGNLVESDVDWRIILRWIFRNWDVEVRTISSWIRIGRGGGQL